MMEYAKRNNIDVKTNPSYLTKEFLSQNIEASVKNDSVLDLKLKNIKEELQQISEEQDFKKKNRNIYDQSIGNQQTDYIPLCQKDRQGSSKRGSSKGSNLKSSIGNKKKTRNNVSELANAYIPTHKSTKSSCIVTSDNITSSMRSKHSKVKNSGENRKPKEKSMQIYKERSYEALVRNATSYKSDSNTLEKLLMKQKVGETFFTNKINKNGFMN